MTDQEQKVFQRKKFTKECPRDVSSDRTDAQKKAIAALSKRVTKKGLVDYSYHIVVGGFILVCVIALASTLFQDRRKLNVIPVINEEKIDLHNSEEHSYRLGRNDFFDQWTLADAKLIVNNQMTTRPSLPRCQTQEDSTIVPEVYNFRDAFASCKRPVVNQGNCSSSYAIAAVSAFSDRVCAQNEGRVSVSLSPQAVLACDPKRNFGCKGGSVSGALDHGKRDGYVLDTVAPYSGEWSAECPNNLSGAERHFVSEYCVTGTEEGVKREILKNGPVVAVIPVYRDFLVYKDGVFDVEEGAAKVAGGQAIKIVGWNKDDDNNSYWIVENSWGETWGLNGLAHVAIGQRQLYIDDFVVAATPRPLATPESQKTEETEVTNQKDDESQPEEVDLDSA